MYINYYKIHQLHSILLNELNVSAVFHISLAGPPCQWDQEANIEHFVFDIVYIMYRCIHLINAPGFTFRWKLPTKRHALLQPRSRL